MVLGCLNGERDDLTGSSWVLVLISAAILVGAAILVALAIGVASRRRNPSRELVTAGAVLWALVSVWSALSTATALFKWGQERDILVQSGYYDPSTRGDGPPKPWLLWGGLFAAYPVLLAFAYGRKPGPSPAGTKSEGSHQPG
ncbi:MAG TPA: hypothetical protein VEN81_09040 [Planctomycetota bacterium]|nr:hypothetical protein [Planctomycetota bacterium]